MNSLFADHLIDNVTEDSGHQRLKLTRIVSIQE